jgi:methyltransferase (TIGR00027 family)
MQPETVSRTALGTAAGRALESLRPEADRLFEDRFAMGFLPVGLRTTVQVLRIPIVGNALLAMRERQIPGIMGNLLCRTRFIDDVYRKAVIEGFEQVVTLGAGFDSRAYRFPGTTSIQVFEVDHPATQARKQERVERMERLHPELVPQVAFVPIDFERQELADELAGAGYRSGVETFFVWEGVTQYIAAEAVDATLRFIARSAASGSRIVFTYIDRGIIDGTARTKGVEKLLSEVERQGEAWRFGIYPAELAGFLAERGFELVEDVGATDYRERYLEPIGRKMNLFDGERVAVAEVASADRILGAGSAGG